jgi:Vacuolar protein sorting-associated protein 35
MESSQIPLEAATAEGAPIPDASQRSEGSGGASWGPTMGTGNAVFHGDATVLPPMMHPEEEYASTASVFTAEQQQGGSITRFAAHTPVGYVSPFAAPTAPTPPSSYAARSQQAYSSASPSYGSTNPSPYSGSHSAVPQSHTTPSPPNYSQPSYAPPQQQQPSYSVPQPVYRSPAPPSSVSQATSTALDSHPPTHQQRILNDAIRNVQEHAYYMKMAMDQNHLAVVLDRAAHMVGELGGPPHGLATSTPPHPNTAQLTPKNYYELYMRALEDMPLLEEYLFHLAATPAAGYTLADLYDCVQYCPRVVSRLYLQIAMGAAWMRSTSSAAVVPILLRDLPEAVRCEQNPVRGLFVRYFLLTALRDHLPDRPVGPPVAETTTTTCQQDDAGKKEEDSPTLPEEAKAPREGTVKDSYEFILANFMEMNKLWVRIQHLPGEGKDKEARKRRERERNDLRILVGTNLVRLAQLECVTSQIYGQELLPPILEHIVTTGDPLSQAYLMDCLVQVFPDEYHIETLPILLQVCPRLRDKVNIRTILQGLMDRLTKYLVGDAELLDEQDTNEVKQTLARDSFGLFEECVQKVYNARGPKLTAKEVIRLQTALLQFSLQCFPGNVEHVGRCIDACVTALRQAHAAYGDAAPDNMTALDDAAVAELEKLLSIPLESLALQVLQFEMYPRLISFLPWLNRREVALAMLQAAVDSGRGIPQTPSDLEPLLQVLEPLLREEHANAPVDRQKVLLENGAVAKLIHALAGETPDPPVVWAMLRLVRQHILPGGPERTVTTLSAVVFAALQLARRVHTRGAAGADVPPGAVVDPADGSAAPIGTLPGAESLVRCVEWYICFGSSCFKLIVFLLQCAYNLCIHSGNDRNDFQK